MIQPPESADQQGFARAVIALLEALDIPYAIGGSVAAMEYGEPRLTIDIDVMVEADHDQLKSLVDAVEAWEIYVTPLETILERGVPNEAPFNIVDGATGTRADIFVVGGEGLSGSAMRRRKRRVWDVVTGSEAWFLSVEDVILFKLVYYRKGDMVADKHPRDIAKITAVMAADLDVAYIERWARDLDVLDLWRALWSPGG